MCRIASLFLLQRLKGSISGDARHFNNIETRAVIKYFSWLSSQGPNYQRGVLVISAGAIEGHFQGKTPREGHQGGLVLAQQCPGSLGTCNPEETGPPYSLDLAPSDYHLFPGLKKQLKGRHFSSDAEVIAAVETWLDRQPSEFFFSDLQKLEQQLTNILSFMGSMLNKSPVWSL